MGTGGDRTSGTDREWATAWFQRSAGSTDSLPGVSTGEGVGRVAAEARARVLIDRQLVEAGWSVQDKRAMNLFAARGVAVREVTLKPGHGRADYLLYVDLAWKSRYTS